MRATLLLIGLVVGLLWPTLSSASAPQAFKTLLQEADSIRTSDPAQFNRRLAELDRSVASATPAQRMHLRLLHAYRFSMAGDSQAAIRELKSLLVAATDVETRYRVGALLANIYALTREYTKSLAVLDRTLPLVGQIEDRDSRHQGLLVASVVYNQVGEYGLGRRYAEQVLADEASGRIMCFAGNLRLEAMQNLGKAPDDESYMAAVRRCQAISEPVAAGLARSYLAQKWYAEGKVVEATRLLEDHLREVEATEYRYLISEFHSLIAQYHMASGDIVSAQRHATAAIAQSLDDVPSMPLVAAYKTLYDIADRRSDPLAALVFYKRYAEADKAYLNDVNAREMAYQMVRQETLQKTQQIELLNRQNAVLQLQQRVDQASAQNSRLLLLLMALLAATIGFWAYKTRRMHSSLRQMAEIDALTGICNRRHFTLQAEQTLAQCAIAGEPAALLMFDLDHFKAINDSYGHTTGDWVLKRVADICKEFCRRIDYLGRIGGEEFAILLYGCDLHVATRLAQDCRVHIAGIDTHESGYRFTVTASFGVSATSLSGYDLAKLLSHADLMLYRAKREGRNRVRTYALDMPITLRPQAGENSSAHVDGPVAEAPSGNQAC